jgi:prolyl-tRNA synthetase
VTSWQEFSDIVATGWARALHCGQPACEAEIKSDNGATPRCIPADAPVERGNCIRCNAPSAYGMRVLFGRAY